MARQSAEISLYAIAVVTETESPGTMGPGAANGVCRKAAPPIAIDGTLDRFSLGAGSGEPECLPLLRPGERQARMLEKHSSGQIGRLTAIEDRAGDVGGEIGQADDPGIVG